MHLIARATRLARRLHADESGLQLIEFALSMPIVLALGGYGIEISNLALSNLQISQYALELADNASRVGLSTGLATTQLREADVNDVLKATQLEGAKMGLTTYGRVTLSSLENVQQSYDAAAVQRIHWQRCIGLKSGTGYDSSYGTTITAAGTTATSANAGTTATSGMGDAGAQVSAPPASGLMFVEVNFDYQPLFGTLFVKAQKLHYVASFIVRDKRDFTQIYNPSPAATRYTCNLYTSS